MKRIFIAFLFLGLYSFSYAGFGGDGLGNHKARKNLNMNSKDITNPGLVDGVDVSSLALSTGPLVYFVYDGALYQVKSTTDMVFLGNINQSGYNTTARLSSTTVMGWVIVKGSFVVTGDAQFGMCVDISTICTLGIGYGVSITTDPNHIMSSIRMMPNGDVGFGYRSIGGSSKIVFNPTFGWTIFNGSMTILTNGQIPLSLRNDAGSGILLNLWRASEYAGNIAVRSSPVQSLEISGNAGYGINLEPATNTQIRFTQATSDAKVSTYTANTGNMDFCDGVKANEFYSVYGATVNGNLYVNGNIEKVIYSTKTFSMVFIDTTPICIRVSHDIIFKGMYVGATTADTVCVYVSSCQTVGGVFVAVSTGEDLTAATDLANDSLGAWAITSYNTTGGWLKVYLNDTWVTGRPVDVAIKYWERLW